MTDQEKLAAIGQALYGTRWQSDLARELSNISDSRRVREWMSGRQIPAWVWPEVASLLRARQTAIDNLLAELEKTPKT